MRFGDFKFRCICAVPGELAFVPWRAATLRDFV